MTSYLVVGEDLQKWEFLRDLSITVDPADRYDIACLLPGGEHEQLTRQLLQQRRLLVPIADFRGGDWQRADFRAELPSGETFQRAAAALAPVAGSNERIDIRNSADYPGLAILGLASTRNSDLTAVRSPALKDQVHYPLLDGIPEQRRLLEQLFAAGLLDRKHFDRLHFCPNCGSSRMQVREECPGCHSSDLKDVSLVHHYRCGFQGTETAFIQQDNLECPKCRKQLRHYGVDYDKPAMVHACETCSEIAHEVDIGFICYDCSTHTRAASVQTRNWFHYQLTPTGFAALQAGVLPHTSLQIMLGKSIGICSNREFSATTIHLSRIAERFKRPLAACAIHIANFDDLRQQFGVSSLASAMMLLGEVIAQIVRNTDLVSASGQSIYLLLAETEPQNLSVVEDRLRSESSKRISLPLNLSVERYKPDSLTELLRKIG